MRIDSLCGGTWNTLVGRLFMNDATRPNHSFAQASAQQLILSTLATPLNELTFLPYIAYPHPVISASTDDTVLDAMRLISTEGVNSVAIVEPVTGNLHSAVSVTDIGKVRGCISVCSTTLTAEASSV